MKYIFCLIGIHNWTITKWSTYEDKKFRKLREEGHDRECEWCNKEQRLEKPKEYHPTAYVWTDIL